LLQLPIYLSSTLYSHTFASTEENAGHYEWKFCNEWSFPPHPGARVVVVVVVVAA